MNRKLNTAERLSEDFYKIDYKDELVQVIREGIYNMNQKALVNKFILRTFEKKPCAHEYVVLANSRLTNNFDFEDKDGEIEIYGIKVEYGKDKMANYTTDLLSVDFGQGVEHIHETINYVKRSGLYVNLKEKKCYFVMASDAITDGTNIITGKHTIRNILSSCTLYKGYSWSNSEERNLRATLVNASKYNAKERIEKLDEQLGGSLSYWMHKSLDFKAIQKLATRNGLQNPGALFLGDFGNDEWGAMFLRSKIRGNSDTTEEYDAYLKERGIALDDNILDGQHIKNAAWLVDVLYKHHNIQTTEDVVAGLMEQERAAGAGNKSAGCYECSELLEKDIIPYVKNNYKYTIIGNPKKIAVIHDTNSAKIPNYNGKGFKSMILDIAKASECAYTSGQLLSKLMFIDKVKTSNFLYSKMRNNLIDMADITDESEFSLTGSLSQVLFGLNNEMARTDIYALTALGKDLMKYAKGAITKCRVRVKGSNYRAQFENTFLITGDIEKRVLKTTKDGYIECFNTDVLSKNRREIREAEKKYKENLKTMTIEEARKIRTEELDEIMVGMALKYPCPGNSEFELFRFLTKEEIKERVFEVIKDKEKAIRAYKYFINKCDGCIILANENILKHKLAGMDELIVRLYGNI